MIYDPEANILCWEIAKGPIVQAKDVGNFIIHFSNNGKPVMIELLEASSFVNKINKLKKAKEIKPLPSPNF